MIAALKDKDEGVRGGAAIALGKIGPAAKDAVPALITAIKDKHQNVRWRAAEALGKIGPVAKVAVPALNEALTDENEDVRVAAVQALDKIQGGTPSGRYEHGLTDITRRLTHAGARVVLCTPTVVGERTGGTNALDGLLDDYAAITRDVAKARDVTLLDLRDIFIQHLRTHNPGNAEQGILTTDGVHLSPEGNRLVAETVLDALQAGG